MKYDENWFSQEKEPSPINAVDKSFDSRVFVVANGFLFFGPCEKLRFHTGGLTARKTDDRKNGFGLIYVGLFIILCGGSKGASGCWDKRRHPEMISEPDSSVGGYFDTLCGGSFTLVGVISAHILIRIFSQLTI